MVVDREPLTIEVLGGSNGIQPAILDRVIGGTVDLDEAKRIGRHLLSITEGAPKAFRIVSQAHQLLYEWHVADEPKNWDDQWAFRADRGLVDHRSQIAPGTRASRSP
jgi:hypothetical protein